MQRYIYGPVPSRRLGYSLGVDIIPYKVCSFDCIYCQLGRTTEKTVKRKEYVNKDEIIDQIYSVLSTEQPIDYITLSGSGEPTLNSEIGILIQEIKKLTQIPVAVLTNSSLLYDEEVRRTLSSADLLLPSLDAARESTFQKINRPHPSLSLDKIIIGLKQLRKEYEGPIWLELMLARGINDILEEIERLKEIISGINPDRVQLNTVVRPPSEKSVHPLMIEELEDIRTLFGSMGEIIPDFPEGKRTVSPKNTEEKILALVKRRPVTLADITSSLGIHRNEAIKYLESLKRKRMIKTRAYRGSKYYEHC